MKSKWMAVAVFAFMCVWLGVPSVLAEDAKALAREVGSLLRSGQSNFFSGRHKEALAQVEQAEELIAQWKTVAPDDPQLKSTEQRCAKLRRDIEARLPRTPPAASSAPVAASSSVTASDKLPSGATFRLKNADSALSRAETSVDRPGASAQWRLNTLNAGIDDARAVIADVKQRYGDQVPDTHPDMVALFTRIEALERRAEIETQQVAKEAQQADQAKATVAAWEARFAPYVYGPGRAEHDPDKWLPSSAPRDLPELAAALAKREEAVALLAEFDNASIGATSDMLDQRVSDLRYAVQSLDESHQDFKARSLDDADTQLAQMEAFIGEQEKNASGGGTVLWVDAERLADVGRKADLVAALVGGNDPRTMALRARIRGVEDRNTALRKARVQQTRVRPDQYAGSDAAELKRLANDVVMKDVPRTRILRTTLPRQDWREESVVEWTDTTRTAWRHRITRELVAEVVGQEGSTANIYTVFLAKDRRADGSWSPVRAHLVYTDEILPENVNK